MFSVSPFSSSSSGNSFCDVSFSVVDLDQNHLFGETWFPPLAATMRERSRKWHFQTYKSPFQGGSIGESSKRSIAAKNQALAGQCYQNRGCLGELSLSRDPETRICPWLSSVLELNPDMGLSTVLIFRLIYSPTALCSLNMGVNAELHCHSQFLLRQTRA